MNTSTMLTEFKNLINEHAYLKDLCTDQAVKIKELEKTQKESEDLLWRRRLFEESIQKVGAVLNEAEKPSLFETTARTKTFEINKEIAEHLRELGKMTSDFHKTGAYETASQIIATLDFEVKNGESLLKIHGIGKGIASKVDQFLDEYFDDEESIASTEGQIIEESESESESESEESEESYNPKLTDIFDKLASYELDSHKRDAYRTAADAIHDLPFKVTNGVELSKGTKRLRVSVRVLPRLSTSSSRLGSCETWEFWEDWLYQRRDCMGTQHTRFPWRWGTWITRSIQDRAYKKAAKIIRELDFEVTSGEELAKGPNKVERVLVKGIAKKIDEFLQTGEIARLEELC